MSTSQLSPEEQAVVRKSLVDRLDAKTRLIQFFDFNARAKHGVPVTPEIENPIVVEKEVIKEVPKVEKVVVEHKYERQEGAGENSSCKYVLPEPNNASRPNPNVPTSPPGNNNQVDTSKEYLKKAAITAALLAGGAATAIALANMFSGDGTLPVKPPAQMQSPLQYLEDQGEHLP